MLCMAWVPMDALDRVACRRGIGLATSLDRERVAMRYGFGSLVRLYIW